MNLQQVSYNFKIYFHTQWFIFLALTYLSEWIQLNKFFQAILLGKKKKKKTSNINSSEKTCRIKLVKKDFHQRRFPSEASHRSRQRPRTLYSRVPDGYARDERDLQREVSMLISKHNAISIRRRKPIIAWGSVAYDL